MRISIGKRRISVTVEAVNTARTNETQLIGASDREVENLSCKAASTYESRMSEAALIGGFHI